MKQIVGSVGKGEGEKRLMIIFQTWLDNLKTFEREEIRLEKRIFFVDYGNRRIKLMNKIRERKDKTSLSLSFSLVSSSRFSYLNPLLLYKPRKWNRM